MNAEKKIISTVPNGLTSILDKKKKSMKKELWKVPLISVITVVRNVILSNRKDQFWQMLVSVRQQNYPHIEHIIVDGKSTDNTVELIKEWISDCNNHIRSRYTCKWISEKDHGIYDAMNTGVHMASGKYIIFLNSDDEFLYNALSVHERALRENNADCSMAAVFVEHSDGNKTIWRAHPARFVLGRTPAHLGMMVSKKVFIALKCFNCSYRFAADYDLMVKLYTLEYKVTYITDELTIFRVKGVSGANTSAIREGNHERVAIYMSYYGSLMNLNKDEVDLLINTDYRTWVQTGNKALFLFILKKIENVVCDVLERKTYTLSDVKQVKYIILFYRALISVFCIDSDGADSQVNSIIGSINFFSTDMITYSKNRRIIFLFKKTVQKLKVYRFLYPFGKVLIYILRKIRKNKSM